MKLGITLIILFVFGVLNSQTNKCNCAVKQYKDKLDLGLIGQGIVTYTSEKPPPEYLVLYPLKGTENTYHKVVYDSASIWRIQPHIRNNAKTGITEIKKLPTTFALLLNFNSLDSIPVYTEANKSSKILYYLKADRKSKEVQTSWLVGCKSGFAKILIMTYPLQTGWIPEENYLHE